MISSPTFDQLLAEPHQTPADWLAAQPHWDSTFGSMAVVLTQPSSTLIVFAFGLLTIVLGTRLWARSPRVAAARWWGTGLILWGAGALSAGVSYQALGFCLRGQGRDFMALTDGFQIAYLALSAASIAALGVAVALRSHTGRGQTWLRSAVALLLGIYWFVLQSGVTTADRFALSFEAMVLITTPSFLIYFAVAAVRWRKTGLAQEARLAWVWVGLGLTFALYGLAAAFGLGAFLWTYGVWFTENDVLHLALAVWMLALYRVVR